MRFTHAAKVAAFPLTALILVALVACQGPAGPSGADGGKGDPGTAGSMGTPGTPGTAGVDALQARAGVGTVFLNPKELVDKEGREIDGVADADADAETKDLYIVLGDYFLGGVPDYTYSLVDEMDGTPGVQNGLALPATDNPVVSAKVDNDTGMLVYTVTKRAETFDVMSYTTPVSGGVKATDSNGVAVEATVSIQLNQAPIGDARTMAWTLGTMDDDRGDDDLGASNADGHMECTEINECVLHVFSDQDDFEVSVTGMTQDGKAVSGLVRSEQVRSEENDGVNIKLIGMATTWVDGEGGTDGAFSPVTVNLKAVDTRGLEKTASVQVNVDAAPMVNDLGRSIDGSSHIVEGKLPVSTDARTWFTDAEGAVTITAVPKTAGVVALGATTDGAILVTGVTVNGTTTITVTATEVTGTLGQTNTVEFTVTVKSVPTS